MSWNVNGLASSNKASQAKLIEIFLHKPDVIALQEVHKLDLEAKDAFHKAGYQLITESIRKEDPSHGGVAMWAAIGLSAVQIPIHAPSVSVPCEVAAMRIFSRNSLASPLSLATWYVSPPRDGTSRETVVQDATSMAQFVVGLTALSIQMLVGDPNARHPMWCPESVNSLMTSSSAYFRGNKLEEITRTTSWTVDNFGATIAPRSSESLGTCPDMVLSFRPTAAQTSVMKEVPTVDHSPHWIVTRLDGFEGTKRKQRVPSYRWDKVDWTPANIQLERGTARIDSIRNPRVAWSILYHTIKATLATFPRGSQCISPGKLPIDLRKLRESASASVERCYDTPTESNRKECHDSWLHYTEALHQWWLSQKAATAHKLNRTMHLPNWSQQLWRFASNSRTSHPPALCSPQGSPLHPTEMATSFLRDWSAKHQIQEGLAAGVRPPTLGKDLIADWIKKEPISGSEVSLAIQDINPKQCPDTIGMQPIFLHNISKLVIRRMAKTFTLLLAHGWCPREMRCSHGIPLPKPQKDPRFTTGYRPVSITLLLSRLLEAVVVRRMQHHLLQKGLSLHPRQFGFRKGLSTSLPVAALFRHLHSEMSQMCSKTNRHYRVLPIAFDFTDAFCRVLPSSVDRQLAEWDIPLPIRNWIWAFLSDRTMRTYVSGSFSESAKMNVGCPQGSILGPFLWLVVMESLLNDLDAKGTDLCPATFTKKNATLKSISSSLVTHGRTTCGFVAYADDLTVWMSGSDETALFNSARALANVVNLWGLKEGIPISSKTQAMLCTPISSFPQNRPPIKPTFVEAKEGIRWDHDPQALMVGDLRIPFVDSIKFLGVHIDSSLQHTRHAIELLKNSAQVMGQLRRDIHFLAPPIRGMVVNSLIGSKVMYLLNSWWTDLPDKWKEKLSSLWAGIARLTISAIATASSRAVVAEAGLLPLPILAKVQNVRLASELWRLPDEYHFLRCFEESFEGAELPQVPSSILPTQEAKNRSKSFAANTRLCHVHQQHNWLVEQRRPPAEAPRRTTYPLFTSATSQSRPAVVEEGPSPSGLQPKARGAKLSKWPLTLITEAAEATRWLTDLNVSIVKRLKVQARARAQKALEKNLKIFEDERILDLSDTESNPEASDFQSSDDDEEVQNMKIEFNNDQQRYVNHCEWLIFTDASVDRMQDKVELAIAESAEDRRKVPFRAASGGAFLIVHKGEVAHQGTLSLGGLACSYSMERETILKALEFLLHHTPPELAPQPGTFHEVGLVTDSLSTLSCLQARGPFKQVDGHNEDIWDTIIALYNKGIRLNMAFVYSHSKVKFNDAADVLAKTALDWRIQGAQWHVDVIRPILQQIIKSDSPMHEDGTVQELSIRSRYSIPGITIFRPLLRLGLSLTKWRLLMQLRTGACPTLGGHFHNELHKCPQCEQLVLGRNGKAVEHLFACDKALPIREGFKEWHQHLRNLREVQTLQNGILDFRGRKRALFDKSEFTPRMLWNNPKVALSYFTKFMKLTSTKANPILGQLTK